MSIIVAKFGGTSVANPDRIRAAAEKIAAEVNRGNKVAVIVSAMAGETNRLLDLGHSFGTDIDQREVDTILASGEQVSAGMMALALQSFGVKARSWQGWQSKIRCDDIYGKARIKGVEADQIIDSMNDGVVPVITGFQGLTDDGRTITLGRGGSDTSAVAMAAAFKADRCDIYTDVDGVYTADPRIVKDAQKIDKINYEAMLEMASLGSKVLQTRSVELAMKEKVPLQVLSSMEEGIGSDLPGTILVEEDKEMEQETVTGIAHTTGEAKVTLVHVPDRPGIAAQIFSLLAENQITVDMIVQNISSDGDGTDITFIVPEGELSPVRESFANDSELSDIEMLIDEKVAKVSIVGMGIRSYASVASKAFSALADDSINIQAISTSEIKLSLLVSRDDVNKAVQSLHNAFNLSSEK